ncbi:MAG TPA: winged helix-turn-helix domain-containing protein [Aliidongia sp.]|nr:winged helix-turn-helix domain-containing protein [Aliidongia sp.]
MDSVSSYRFSRFELDPVGGILLRDARQTPLNPRAFRLLELLVKNHDRLVTKDEIMDHVWGGVFVEENNLAVQISTLRKALGNGPHGQPFIVNVPGQGYRFVGPVGDSEDEKPEIADPVVSGTPKGTGKRHWLPATALAAAIGGAAALILGQYWMGADQPQRLSIVVMPFRNLSIDPDQAYLADAVSDDLTTDLARLPGSFVISRESANTYRDKTTTAQDVGRKFNVRYMLEGSVRGADDRLLVNAQLIDAGTGAHLWAERFDTTRTAMGRAQEEIVRRIAGALNFRLVRIESDRSLAQRPQDPDAMDLFFRARSMLDRDRSPQSMDVAQKLLEQAITLQPSFVDALNQLSWLLLRREFELDSMNAEDLARAEALTDQARALDPQNGMSAANEGMLLLINGHCQEAISGFQLAMSLDPSNLAARDGISLCNGMLGRPDGMIDALHEAIALSPEDPQTKDRYGHLGMALLLADRPGEALEWLLKAEAAQAQPAEKYQRGLIEAYAQIGQLPKAREKFAAYQLRWPRRSVWRESCYAGSKATSALPGLRHALTGLLAAGMPEFADESADDGIAPPSTLQPADLYAATPLAVPGAETVRTTDMPGLITATLILDVGCGGAVPPGALFLPWAEDGDRLDDEIQPRLAKEIDMAAGGDRQKPIVVMGAGIHGWGPYNTVLRLEALGYRKLYWYRGGEEALAAAQMATEDRRSNY